MHVCATVGSGYNTVVLELADNVRILDGNDPSSKCVDDVQQYFHDTCGHHLARMSAPSQSPAGILRRLLVLPARR